MFARRSHAISSVEDGFACALAPMMLAPRTTERRGSGGLKIKLNSKLNLSRRHHRRPRESGLPGGPLTFTHPPRCRRNLQSGCCRTPAPHSLCGGSYCQRNVLVKINVYTFVSGFCAHGLRVGLDLFPLSLVVSAQCVYSNQTKGIGIIMNNGHTSMQWRCNWIDRAWLIPYVPADFIEEK